MPACVSNTGSNANKGWKPMPVIAVMYPAGDARSFDLDYYMVTHMPLVRRLWGPMGLTNDTVMQGVPGPDGAAPTYTVMTLLTFDSMDSFKAGAAAHGKEIFKDIPNFYPGSPVLQFNEPQA